MLIHYICDIKLKVMKIFECKPNNLSPYFKYFN